MTSPMVRLGARWGAAALVLAFLAPVRPAAEPSAFRQRVSVHEFSQRIIRR